MSSEWQELTEKQFYKVIYDNELDVHPWPIGEWPYTSLWKLRDGRVVAKSVEQKTGGQRYYFKRSFLGKLKCEYLHHGE